MGVVFHLVRYDLLQFWRRDEYNSEPSKAANADVRQFLKRNEDILFLFLRQQSLSSSGHQLTTLDTRLLTVDAVDQRMGLVY
jgi:hypothetical protein